MENKKSKMQIFISYSPEDQKVVERFIKFLSIYERNNEISFWSNHQILPGENQQNKFQEQLQSSDIIILCISPDYLASEKIWTDEVEKAYERHLNGEIVIIPILFRTSPIEITKLSKLKALPRNEKPIKSVFWQDDIDACFKEICQEILKSLYIVKNDETPKIVENYNFIVNKKNQIDENVDDNESLAKDLEQLTKNKVDVKGLLKASPFDQSNDIDGFLTVGIFFNYLYVESNSFLKAKIELYNSLENKIYSDQVIFLSGFSGNGKTTFIQSFIKDNKEFDHIYYDFADRTTNYSTISRNDKLRRFASNAEVINLLHRKLRGDYRFINTFKFVVLNRFELKDYGLITYEVYEMLESISAQINDLNQKDIVKCMMYFHFKDSLSFFFIHLFINYTNNKKKVVYFDNLDVVSIEYITSEFLVAFEEALINGIQLSRSSVFRNFDIKFTSEYRFVFCLREANSALINKHILDRIGLKKLDFKVNFGSDFYKRIIKKRVELVKGIYTNEELMKYGYSLEELLEALDVLTNDRYFNDVFIPLFNYDYRDAIDALFYTILEYKIQNKKWNPYAIRAMLMFGLIKKMKISNFLIDYPNRYPKSADGYCLIDRVVLTYILNRSEYYRKIGEFDKSSTVTLTDLILGLSNLYGIEEILESVARCFLYHEKSWVHLITIYGVKITSEKKFIREFKNYFDVEDENVDSYDISLEKTDSIKIKINPAGFVYLRYVLMHFEFYSVLVNNKKPLFLFKGQKNENGKFDFEEPIDKTFELAKRHISNMRLFFKNIYHTKNGIDEGMFFSSDYCFKHLGKSEGFGRKSGYFHSTRIISSHIEHLDQYRRILLESDFPQEYKISINKIIINKIRKYINLWLNSKDKRAEKELIPSMLSKILEIEHSGFLDFETRVNINKRLIV